MRRLWTWAGLAILAAAANAQSFEPLGAQIQQHLDQTDVPSLAVVVARDGAILWEAGFGYADRERKIPATADTMYSIASITKPFTATGLMTLVAAGKVDLDAPVNNYLRDGKVRAMVGDVEDATVRRVANHTSGLPLHGHFYYETEPGRLAPASTEPPPMDETIRRYGILVTPPGETYQYSNLGYGILGRAIELVSGMTYPDFLQQRVFAPLGLTHTSVGRRIPEALYAVRYGAGFQPAADFTTDHVAASAIWSSAADLARFGMFHLGNRLPDAEAILTDEVIQKMQTPGSGAAAGYGIGWNIGKAKGYKVVSHGGDMTGVTSLLVLLPSEKIVVAAVANRSPEAAGPLIDEAVDGAINVLLPGWKDRPPAADPEVPPPIPESWIGNWKGQISTYVGTEPVSLNVTRPDTATLKIGDHPEQVVRGLHFDGTYLRGVSDGFIDTPDARQDPQEVGLQLKVRGAVLSGALTSFSQPPNGWLGNALTSWLELKKR